VSDVVAVVVVVAFFGCFHRFVWLDFIIVLFVSKLNGEKKNEYALFHR
jgi:hypothetical protein